MRAGSTASTTWVSQEVESWWERGSSREQGRKLICTAIECSGVNPHDGSQCQLQQPLCISLFTSKEGLRSEYTHTHTHTHTHL